MISISRVALSGTAALLLSLGASNVLVAQSPDPRWQAWLGCWRPDATPTVAPIALSVDSIRVQAPSSLVCVLPGSTPTSVDVVNFTNGRLATRATIEPTGERIPKSVDDCKGWEIARWSKDNRRVMLQSEFTCANNVVRKESGLAAMTPTGDWMQVQNLSVEGNNAVYVGRLRHTGMAIEGVRDGALIERPMLDEEGRLITPSRAGCTGAEGATPSADGRQIVVRGDLDCGGLRRVSYAVFERNSNGQWARVDKTLPAFSTATARLAAGSPVKTDAVLEMTEHVEQPVLETWLADRDQRFYLNGRDLLELADRGVSPRIIDLLVALDNPGALSVRATTHAVAVAPNRPEGVESRGGGRGEASGSWGGGYVDPWLNPWDPYGYRWRYGLGDVGFGNGYGYGNGYGCWGCYNRGWGGNYPYGNGVVVVVPRGTPTYSARAVPGMGYTRDGSRPASQPSSTAGRPTGSDARAIQPSTTTRGGSGTAGTSTSGGGTTGRTAKARGGN